MTDNTWLYLDAQTPYADRQLMGALPPRVADARQHGGMIAAVPREDCAQLLAVPGGEPVEELHLTLVYLGDDVTGQSPDGVERLTAQFASENPAIPARVFGHALFNPQPAVPLHDDTNEAPEPCAVYLVNDQAGQETPLTGLQGELATEATRVFDLPRQHRPFTAHVTAGYGLDVAELDYVGDIVFDRLRLAFGGNHTDYPLTGR